MCKINANDVDDDEEANRTIYHHVLFKARDAMSRIVNIIRTRVCIDLIVNHYGIGKVDIIK